MELPLDLFDLRSSLHPLLRAGQVSPLLERFAPSTITDGFAIWVVLISIVGYATRGRYWDKPDPHYHVYFEKPQVAENDSCGKADSTRNIAQRLEEGNHECVIFWGSQSGTAERFAEELGRECASRFNINALVADLSDYDADSIASVQDTHFAIFLLSTYGEGDPSDNASGLWDWIKHIKTNNIVLGKLKYIAFGLGNSNYQYYNRVLDVVADALDEAGAHALIPRQKADDANGATEEDFQSWKDDIFALFRSMGYEQQSVAYQPSITINFNNQIDETSGTAVSPLHQQSSTNSAAAPLVIKSARELFVGGDRNCVHMELDLGSTQLGYKTGDHIGIWPCNPDKEVERLADVLSLQNRLTESLTVVSHDKSAKPKLPSSTTLDAAFRHHLEICGPVSRKTVLDLAQFAPTSNAKATLLELGQDRERYRQFLENTHITFGRLLQFVSPKAQWTDLPLSFVVDALIPLQPRYYSISSSSVISPRRIAITALVVNKQLPASSNATIHGLTSNYILSAANLTSAATTQAPTYRQIEQSGGTQSAHVLAHVRKSKFKLPITSSTPLVLVSAGTGFAPFRAFLQERAKLHAIGKPIGSIVLFFGCRNQDDFIYREEIEKIQSQLGEKLKVITAFSRDGGSAKKYVQNRVEEHASEVLDLLDAGANMYICGKASMAREVDVKIEAVVRSTKQMSEAEAKAWGENLKKRGKWKADVWG